MIRGKLLYACLLVIAVFFFILYRGRLSFELLIFAFLFPIPLWLSTFLLKRSLHMRVLQETGISLEDIHRELARLSLNYEEAQIYRFHGIGLREARTIWEEQHG